jgi:hypothetical protein
VQTEAGPELVVVELATGELNSFALTPGDGWSSAKQSPPSQPVILPGYVALTSGRCVYYAHADGADVHPVFCDPADLPGVAALDPAASNPAILVAGRSGRLYRIPV